MNIKSTIPVGFTAHVCKKYHRDSIIFSLEFLCESKALYDNFQPSRIIVGTEFENERLINAVHIFSELLKEGAIKENIDILFIGFIEDEAFKLFANTHLELRVSHFNELDKYTVIKGLKKRQLMEYVLILVQVIIIIIRLQVMVDIVYLQIQKNYQQIMQMFHRIGCLLQQNQIELEKILQPIKYYLCRDIMTTILAVIILPNEKKNV